MDEQKLRKIERALREALERWDKAHRMSEPDFEPLERVLRLLGLAYFMGYEAGPEGSGGIRLYKHALSRHYLYLDEMGIPYAKHEGEWKRIPLSLAIHHYLGGGDEPIEDYLRALAE